MEITQTSSDGLKRTLKVVIGASEINERFSQRIDQVKDQVQLKGFRKGKVPAAHIKKVYGRSLMAEVLQEAVRDTSSKAIAERKERPALQPDIKLPEDQAEIEKVIEGKADLAYSMEFEVIPDIAIADLDGIKLERLVAEVDDAARDKALGELAGRSVTYTAEEGRAASDKDRVIIDFVGKIDGEAFDGGTGEGMGVVLGAGSFIPGFEDGITGAKAGEERVVKATFPAEYPVKTLAGKEATFDVKVKAVEAPNVPAIDDELAKSLGIEDLAKLKELITEQIKKGYDDASRTKLKRELLDALEAAHDFELPPSLVETEFNAIWQQLTNSMKGQGKSFPDEGKTEDEARAEYRKIAQRRVRLGLVIGEIGEKNGIAVSQDELRRALIEQARRYPGQEKMVYEYFEKTPGALAELRAPIFEDKVVDFILDKAKPSEKTVTSEELMKQVEEATLG
jgi:trigger factor